MKLTGGYYGGYTVENDNAVLCENDVIVDTQAIVMDGTNLVINGWVYNEEGIFIAN